MVRQTPRIGLSYCYIVDYKRKSGVSGFRLFASLGPRKTCTNEQNRIDTHAVGIYSTPVKACLKAWLAFGTPNGTVIYLPAAPTSAMSLTYAFEFPRFKEAKNKASATHSQNVVLPPYSRSGIPWESARRELAPAKIRK